MRNTFIVVTVLPDLSKIDCEPEMDSLNDDFISHKCKIKCKMLLTNVNF